MVYAFVRRLQPIQAIDIVQPAVVVLSEVDPAFFQQDQPPLYAPLVHAHDAGVVGFAAARIVSDKFSQLAQHVVVGMGH